MRLILSDVLADVAQILNLNEGDPRVVRYINRGQEELLNKGRWVGTTIKYRICANSGHITWPRELATIEAMQVNGKAALLKNQWFEFLEYGADFRANYYGGAWTNGWMENWGVYGGNSMAVDQGEAIAFAEVCGTGNAKKLKVYGTAMESADSRILLQFYDGQGNYVRTNDTTEGWVDGEFVAINSVTPQLTVSAVTSYVGVQKPVTNGTVRIVEYDTVTTLERPLAIYEPSETSPAYRRTNVERYGCQPGCRSVTVIGKQRFIPALKPRDYLCLQSQGAIIAQAQSVYKRDNNDFQGAQILSNVAEQLLDQELGAWIGSGSTQQVGINLAYNASNGPNYVI